MYVSDLLGESLMQILSLYILKSIFHILKNIRYTQTDAVNYYNPFFLRLSHENREYIQLEYKIVLFPIVLLASWDFGKLLNLQALRLFNMRNKCNGFNFFMIVRSYYLEMLSPQKTPQKKKLLPKCLLYCCIFIDQIRIVFHNEGGHKNLSLCLQQYVQWQYACVCMLPKTSPTCWNANTEKATVQQDARQTDCLFCKKRITCRFGFI